MSKQLFQKNILAAFFIALPFCSVIAQTPSPLTLKGSIAKGKALYLQYCLSCHQADGDGVPNMNPSLIKTTYVLGDKKRLITWVLKGSTGTKLSINGKVYSNNMPPQSTLKDDEIAAILTYVRNDFGNKATPVAAAQVKAVRAAIK
jgi:mono/diheme cytochrome c family protein